MTRAKYVILLNIAIANGRAAEFRQRHPSPAETPDSVYDFTFPPAPPDLGTAMSALRATDVSQADAAGQVKLAEAMRQLHAADASHRPMGPHVPQTAPPVPALGGTGFPAGTQPLPATHPVNSLDTGLDSPGPTSPVVVTT